MHDHGDNARDGYRIFEPEISSLKLRKTAYHEATEPVAPISV